ncbi:hypothetical protein [Bradyrhizobium lablabi]|uniref:hypothetical protein n=1 Tax=Bradyrhizobium lablabi TaxID=722472 RepID=UPI001BA65BA2|nr:hypothetical protein [Bradyrhizobium lablabi]MBR0694279.1 hypothetical protein [Bradyrhizobium lablabi]
MLNRFKAKAKATPAEDHEPSPLAKLKAANVELQEELLRLKQRGDGNTFSRSDSKKSIAAVVIGTFDGLSNKTARVKAIARELNAWLKAQRSAS